MNKLTATPLAFSIVDTGQKLGIGRSIYVLISSGDIRTFNVRRGN
jgi:hypothetical protein